MKTADAPAIESARDEPRESDRPYALALSETEMMRYQQMAEQARVAEADLWQRAGIAAGAQVADIGCGPGALLPALSGAVGPMGRVIAIDADPGRSPRPRPWSWPAAEPMSPSDKVERSRLGCPPRHAMW